jgi:hypothetical protein
MDKQIFNIKLLDNGDIQFKTGRTETPRNRVLTLTTKQVELLVNEKYLVTIDTDDYFNHAFWANRLSMDHADIRAGVVAVDTGFTHKSVAAIIKQTTPGQRVGYKDGNRFNLRADNLYIKGEEDE